MNVWPAIRKKIPMFVMVPNLVMVTNFGIVLAFVIIPDLAMVSNVEMITVFVKVAILVMVPNSQ